MAYDERERTRRDWRPDTAGHAGLIDGIMAFLVRRDLLGPNQIRAGLEREIEQAGVAALTRLKARLVETDEGWNYHPPDPLARRIHEVLADRLLDSRSLLTGAGHLAAMAGAPVVIFGNHLSYADANLFDILLRRFGEPAFADRLTAMAGPKVFTDTQRHFSSLCFGTIRTPQNAGLSSDEAMMSARDVARAARHVIDLAHARLRQGDAILVFGEGRRSRTASMQPLLTGVARYVDAPGTWILPIGITGTEQLFPIDDDSLHQVRVDVTIGAPFEAARLRKACGHDRRLLMDAIGCAVAEGLPASYQGVYGVGHDMEPARRVLAKTRQPIE